jgi:hypothetical protein
MIWVDEVCLLVMLVMLYLPVLCSMFLELAAWPLHLLGSGQCQGGR